MAERVSGRHSGNRNKWLRFGFLVEPLETRRLLSATLLSQIPTQTVQPSSTATINLGTYFDDSSIPTGDTVVDIQTNMPGTVTDIPLELTTTATPNTVANFLQYITSGEYADTIIHRSVANWVIQGGGYTTSGNAITTFGNISGESSTEVLSNTLGTIAMALSNGPDSATSQWFINLGNNSAALDGTADGGPFTVFGQVIYNGMTCVNAIAALTTVNANGNDTNGPFGNLPLQNASGNITPSNLVVINPVVVTDGVNFTAVSGNTSMITANINNGVLILTPVSGVTSGTTTVTVTATDLGGGNATSTFTVTIPAKTAFSNLTGSPSVSQGTASVAFGGTITAGALIPPATETVAITLNGVTQNATINAQGNFSTTFNISALPASNTPYQVTYAYAGDASFNSVTDNTTTTLLVMPTNGTEVPVYRLFSQVTKEHLYTADLNEYNTLGSEGWDQEGLAYNDYNGLVTIGGVTTIPLYRLYNIPDQQHLWTTDPNEYNTLKDFVGTWSVDGISGYIFPANGNASTSLAAVPGSAALYRMSWPFNPAADIHLWTTDLNEYDTDAATYGWTKEGIIGYVL